MASKRKIQRADSIEELKSQCSDQYIDAKLSKFIEESDKWDGGMSFATFCEDFKTWSDDKTGGGGGSTKIQRGGNGESIIIGSVIGNELMIGETNSQMPMEIKVFLNKAKKGTKSYLLFAHETQKFLLINGYNGFQKFKGYVYVGAFYALNTTIIQYICEGHVVLWNNSTVIVPAIKYVASNALKHTSTLVALATAGVGKAIPPVLNLAGINLAIMVVAGVVCACLAAYLGYRFFEVVENTNLTEHQEKEIEQFRLNALMEKFRVEAKKIGIQKVENKDNDKEIAQQLVEIEKSLVRGGSPTETLKKYSELFKIVNKGPIQKLSIAYLYASYINTVLSKFPQDAVETTLGDLKQMIAIVGGVNTNDYPGIDVMPPEGRVELFNLEFKNIFNDLIAVFVAVSGPIAAVLLISNQLKIYGKKATLSLTTIKGTLDKFLEFVQTAAARDILDEHVKFEVRPSPDALDSMLTDQTSTGGSSSRRRRKSSRRRKKQKKKRKTIRRKVSKTKKRTLNKKSKKRSKTKRIRK